MTGAAWPPQAITLGRGPWSDARKEQVDCWSLLRMDQALGFLKQVLGFPVKRPLLHLPAQLEEGGGSVELLAELEVCHGQKRQVGPVRALPLEGSVELLGLGQGFQG